MKLLKALKFILASLLFVFGTFSMNAQWTGNSTIQPTTRSGNTGIGNFGLGSPNALLHISKSGHSPELVMFRLQGAGTISSGSQSVQNVWDTELSNQGTYMLRRGMNTNTSGVVRLALTSSGSLGLGTISPQHRLHVIGSGKFNNNLYVDDRLGIGTTSPSQALTVFDSDEPVIRLEREGSKWDWEIFSKSGGHLVFRGGGNGTGTNGNEVWGDKFIITGTGRVGIGVDGTPPNILNADGESYNLYVTGGIITEEVKVEADFADYVFEADYNLLPLEKVEQHIQEKGHLHNTPSGKTIQENGMDLGSITVNQQEKIEELFLHLIDLKKEVEKLKLENSRLKNSASNKSN